MGIALNQISESDRERIARSLFEVKTHDIKKGELHGLCPLHGEKNPSFSYNYRSDVYHCFSCGEGGDLVRLWYKLRGYSSDAEGFQAFCREFDIDPAGKRDRSTTANVDGRSEEKEPPGDLEGVWELFEPLPESRIRELEASRGWTRRTIELMDLRLQTHLQDSKSGKLKKISNPDRIAIPIRDSKNRLVNIRLYRPGGGQDKMISWTRYSGRARLFPAVPLLPSDPVLLCEGEPDTICALSKGLNAITQTSKTKSWSKEHLEPFRGREVIIAYDADEAGQKYSVYAAKSLSEVTKSVRLLDWPEYMGRQSDGSWPNNHGEDLTDFFVKHKKNPGDLFGLMATARFYILDEDSSGLEYLRFFEKGANDRLSFKAKLLAERIIRDMSLLWHPSTGLFYRWNGRIWKPYPEELIGKKCCDYLGLEYAKSRVDDVVNYVRLNSTISDERELNDIPYLVSVENGQLDLKTLELKPHDKNSLCTHMLPVIYNEDSIQPPYRFLQFMDETIQTSEPINMIQEFTGYCLTPSTEYEKCLLLLGPGADGKSTYLKILRELVGPENCSSVSFNDLEDQFQRSALFGKLLNISTEVGSKAIESPYFKAITSGDPLNAAVKFRSPFSFRPTAKLAFAANRLPRVRDNSDGFFRRILPIQFKRQFLDDADPGLFELLKSELSGIFEWAIVGLHRLWYQKGFTKCNESKKLLLDYRRVNNPVLAFVEDRCIIDDKKEVSKDELYRDYRGYCGENGYTAMNKENFFKELYSSISTIRQLRPQVNGQREYVVKGISIVNDN